MGTSGNNLEKDVLKAEVQHLLDTLVGAQETGNWELFAQCFVQSPDTVNIGTDVDEYWSEWESFKKATQNLFRLKRRSHIQVKNISIHTSDDGKVAWYSMMMDTCLETKSEPVRIEGFRHTGVLQKQNGHWKIVQSHVSVPVLENVGIEHNYNSNLVATI
ncbi:MAG: nuclear transport factor 2 family protein [Breznakibacter sp.]